LKFEINGTEAHDIDPTRSSSGVIALNSSGIGKWSSQLSQNITAPYAQFWSWNAGAT
jgi:hypothetical protein